MEITKKEALKTIKDFIWNTHDGERLRFDEITTRHAAYILRLLWDAVRRQFPELMDCGQPTSVPRLKISKNRAEIRAYLFLCCAFHSKLANADDLYGQPLEIYNDVTEAMLAALGRNKIEEFKNLIN